MKKIIFAFLLVALVMPRLSYAACDIECVRNRYYDPNHVYGLFEDCQSARQYLNDNWSVYQTWPTMQCPGNDQNYYMCGSCVVVSKTKLAPGSWTKIAVWDSDPADTDGDGTSDITDQCKYDPFKTEPGVCGCGEEDNDSDGDSVYDCYDIQPDDWNPEQQYVATIVYNFGAGSGNETEPRTCTPINFSTGNKYKRQTDLLIDGPGLPFGFNRFYNSQNPDQGILGYGWTATFSDRINVSSDEITLIQSDARHVNFVDDGQGQFISVADKVRVIEAEGDGYRLTEPDGRAMSFNNGGQLVTIQDTNGNTQTITYSEGKISSVTDSFGRSLTFGYSGDGRLSTLTTPVGQFTYSYDAAGNLVRVDNPDATFKTYIYDDPNDVHNLTGIIDENNIRAMTTAYDNLDRVVYSESAGGFKRSDVEYVSDNVRSVTDSRGNTTTFQLAVSHGIGRIASSSGSGCSNCAASLGEAYQFSERLWIDSETNAEGAVTNYTYDERGNILTRTEAVGTPEQRTTTYTWHPIFSKIATITRDSVANPGQTTVTSFDYDPAGNLLTASVSGYEASTPITRTTGYTYNTSGQPLSVDGPRTDVVDVTTFTYYPNQAAQGLNRGRLMKITNALDQETLFADYNAWGKPQSITDINGVETTFIFDAAGKVLSFTRDGKTTLYGYDNVGRMLSVTLPGGRVVTYTYTAAGLVETITDNLGNYIRYTYDTEGNRIREEIHDDTGVLAKFTDFTFDEINRLEQVIYPDARAESYSWDHNNNLTAFTDAAGRTATRSYDPLNRLKSLVQTLDQPDDVVTAYGYDSHDNLTTVTDAESHTTQFVFSDLGLTMSEDSPDAGITLYTYDEAGNLASKTDANGITVNYTYDSLNRLTGINYPDSVQNVSYTYDEGVNAKGRLSGMTDQSGAYTYAYDTEGNLVSEERIIEGIIYSTTYTYDATGILTGISYPNGRTVSYTLDAAGRVTTVTTTLGGSTAVVAENLTYLPFGPLNGYDAGNGTHIANDYDSSYRTTGITAGSLMDLDYTLDPAGNITGIADGVDAAKNQTFGYDSLYRLTGAAGIYGTIDYTYDKVGNRLTRTENGQTDTYQYIPGTNRLQQVTGANPQSFTIDSAGNMISAGSRSYIYNQNNRLIEAREGIVVVGNYTYNANGQRIIKTIADGTVIFHYDIAGNIIGESTPGGDFTANYIYLGSLRLAAVLARPLDEFTVSVITSEGRGLSGINVYAFTESGAYTGKRATTDETGKAVFNPEEFTDGSYMFRADYLSDKFWSDVVALPGSARAEIIIEEKAVTVQVIQAGAAKEGVKVYLFNESGAYLGIFNITDENGNVDFVLPVGQGFKFRADVLGGKFMSDILTVTSGGTGSFSLATGGGTLTAVLEKQDGTPISGINMYLFSSAGSYLGLKEKSDDFGKAYFDVPDGTYKVRADYMGYKFWTDEISVSADTQSTLTIDHQDVIVTVNRDLDGNVQAAEDIPVYLFTSSGSYLGIKAYTDAQGEVVFNLPAQDYKVRADYVSCKYWSQVFNQSDETVTIEEGSAAVTVTGMGLSIPGVKVYAFNDSGAYLGLNAITDAVGMVDFRLPAGDYNFRADYMGSQYFSGNSAIIAHVDNPVGISTGGGNLTLMVESQPSSPMEGISCYLFSAAGAYLGDKKVTRGSGEAEFNLADGLYKIRVDYLGYKYWTEVFTIPVASDIIFEIFHQDVTVTVSGDDNGDIQAKEGVKVYLFTAAGAYMGRNAVTDGEGQAIFSLPAQEYKFRADYLGSKYWTDEFDQIDSAVIIAEGIASVEVSQGSSPLEGVNVYVFSETGAYLGLKETTAADGIAEFRLPEDTYKFRADHMGSKYWITSAVNGHVVNEIALNTGGGTFDLIVQKDNGEALSGVPVYVFSTSGAYLGVSATTDDAGLVSFDLADGDYKFRADYMGYKFWTSDCTVPNTLSYALQISHADVTVTVNQEYAYDTTPLSDIPVYLFSASGAYMGIRQNTDNAGKVTFNLPEQEYKARADYLSQKNWSEVFSANDEKINIEHGQVSVHVHETGIDVLEAKVYTFTESGRYLGRVKQTDSSGMASFLLPEGAYKFRVDYSGSQSWSDAISIIAHDEATVEMDLDLLVSDLTNSPHPVRFDGLPPKYEPEKLMLASLGSIQGLLTQLVVGQIAEDKLFFYINDHVGKPQAIIDDAGEVVWKADYLPFGTVVVNANANVENNFRFAGQYYDAETALHYNYYRYYGPKIGGYLRTDPIGLSGGIHLFLYASNNPVNYTDQFGLDTTGKGVNINLAAIGFSGNANIQIVSDNTGDQGIAITVGGGGYSEVAGGSLQYTTGATNATSINALAGTSTLAGGGIVVPPLPGFGIALTGDFVFTEDYKGKFFSLGPNVGFSPIEVYAMRAKTYVINYSDLIEAILFPLLGIPLPEDNLYKKDNCPE
jgi:RHS repeat-associated protein